MRSASELPKKDSFATVWRSWWAQLPTPTPAPPGIACRLDLLDMYGSHEPPDGDAAKTFMKQIVAQIDGTAGTSSLRWSPGVGTIYVHYGALTREAVELKHSVLRSAIERCVRESIKEQPAVAAAETAGKTPRIVDWEQFQAICGRAQARPDQVQVLDVGEAVFGAPSDDQALSRRFWTKVERYLEETLTNGYATRYSRGRVLLFFPGFSKTMGEMKRKAMTEDIGRLAGDLRRPEPQANGDAKNNEAAAPPAPRPRKARPHGPMSHDDVDGDLADRAFAAIAAAQSAGMIDPAAAELPPDVEVRPVPMWWAKNRTVGGYVLEMAQRLGDGLERVMPETLLKQGLNLDLGVLTRAFDRIHQLHAAGKTSLVVVPVHWPYLERERQRTLYLTFASRLPAALRRLLVFELADIPAGLMSARVEERVGQLRPYCRSVICRVKLGRHDYAQFKSMAVHAIGVDLGELPDYERGIIPAFDSFMDAAEPLGLRTYAFGLTTTSLLVAVQAAGIDYVAGSVIPDSDTEPLGIRDFMISDLYGVSEGR